MIICVCRKVSDRAICRLVAEGASSADEVARRSGAGTGCGSCRAFVARLVDQSRHATEPPVALEAPAA